MDTNIIMSLPRNLSQVVAGNIDGRAAGIRYRQREFQRLQKAILDNLEELKDAIAEESGHTDEEVQTELVLSLKEIHTHYTSLDLAQSLEAEYSIANGKDNVGRQKPVGIVYIIPTQHTLFYSVVAALSAAIAAGNCVVLELPESSSCVSSSLRPLLLKTLDSDTFTITETRPDKEFVQSTLILEQDAQPTQSNIPRGLAATLPFRTAAIVDRTANLADAVADLVTSRLAFGGRSPYAPDVIFVNEFCVQSLIDLLTKEVPRYLSRGSTQRRQSPVKEQGNSTSERIDSEKDCEVIISGTGWAIARVYDRDSSLLHLKIYGRILLIHTVSSLDDAINLCNSIGSLQATFTFAAPAAAKYVSESIDASVAWVNHIPYNILVGPVIPYNTTPALETRYPQEIFQVSRAQILHQSANGALAKSLLISVNGKQKSEVLSLLMTPLKIPRPTSASSIGFFEQGFVSGGIIILVSLFTAGVTVGYKVWASR